MKIEKFTTLILELTEKEYALFRDYFDSDEFVPEKLAQLNPPNEKKLYEEFSYKIRKLWRDKNEACS